MTEGPNLRCRITCWVIAAIVGITVVTVWVALGLWALFGFFGGVIAFGITGWLLSTVMCTDIRAEAAERQAMFDVAARALGQSPSAAPSASPAAARAVAEEIPAAQSQDAAGKAPSAAETDAPDQAGTAPTAGSEDDGAQEAEDEALAATGPGASEAEAVPEADPAPVPDAGAASQADATPAAAAGEGTQPAGLDGPRDGGADNLKEIKGVGPKLEQLLNSMGYYHFDQIAGWTATEVAWVDQNLQGFKGRVSRDNWVDQARILASGGETEFSKKVDRGGVY